jgi:hypothetical protein
MVEVVQFAKKKSLICLSFIVFFVKKNTGVRGRGRCKDRQQTKGSTQFTYFTGTKVQILTH